MLSIYSLTKENCDLSKLMYYGKKCKKKTEKKEDYNCLNFHIYLKDDQKFLFHKKKAEFHILLFLF